MPPTLQGLPRELRDKIYEQAVVLPHGLIRRNARDDGWSCTEVREWHGKAAQFVNAYSTLCRASHQIRAEVTEQFFGRNSFAFMVGLGGLGEMDTVWPSSHLGMQQLSHFILYRYDQSSLRRGLDRSLTTTLEVVVTKTDMRFWVGQWLARPDDVLETQFEGAIQESIDESRRFTVPRCSSEMQDALIEARRLFDAAKSKLTEDCIKTLHEALADLDEGTAAGD